MAALPPLCAERREQLVSAPVAFDPDPASAAMGPVARDPAGVFVGWLDVGSGNPDVTAAVPAMVSGLPDPVGMFDGSDGNDFHGAARRADAHRNLGRGREACAENQSANGGKDELLHVVCSFRSSRGAR